MPDFSQIEAVLAFVRAIVEIPSRDKVRGGKIRRPTAASLVSSATSNRDSLSRDGSTGMSCEACKGNGICDESNVSLPENACRTGKYVGMTSEKGPKGSKAKGSKT